jgi:hypothetical protein
VAGVSPASYHTGNVKLAVDGEDSFLVLQISLSIFFPQTVPSTLRILAETLIALLTPSVNNQSNQNINLMF